MQLNDTMVLETTIGKRAGTPKTFQFTLGDFPPVAVEKFLRYGFQRVFNDAVGGEDTTHEEKIAEVAAMIERFKKGDVGRAPRESVDALTNECRIVLRAHLRTHKKDVWAKHKNDEPAALNTWLDAIVAKPANVWIVEKAQTEVTRKQAERAALASQSVDL